MENSLPFSAKVLTPVMLCHKQELNKYVAGMLHEYLPRKSSSPKLLLVFAEFSEEARH